VNGLEEMPIHRVDHLRGVHPIAMHRFQKPNSEPGPNSLRPKSAVKLEFAMHRLERENRVGSPHAFKSTCQYPGRPGAPGCLLEASDVYMANRLWRTAVCRLVVDTLGIADLHLRPAGLDAIVLDLAT